METTHLPVLMLDDEPLGLGSGLGKAFLCHLAALFDTPLQQEALVGFEQLQLVGLLQLLPPEQTSHMSPSVHSHRQQSHRVAAGRAQRLFIFLMLLNFCCSETPTEWWASRKMITSG